MSDARVVIVTGNGGAIGRAIQSRLSSDGFTVIGTHANGSRDYDVNDLKEIENLIYHARIPGNGLIYGLVNNAGVLDIDEFNDITEPGFDFVMRTNVLAPLRFSEEVVRFGCENIVNISGLYGKTGAYGRKPVYAASKAALNNLTLSLARMLAPDVRVNAVLPGIVPTPIHDDPPRHPPHGHALLQRTGTPEDVANAVAWLMSDESSYVTGHLMEVCGGR
jgi:NAD(P)-dependent dehydrogenase (short-subunit alcohol dehydrogenase family)